MKTARIASIVLGATLFPFTIAGFAHAGPTCINDGIANYYFSKLKLPKKAGQSTAVQGVRAAGVGGVVSVGAATMLASGEIRISLHMHTPGGVGNDFTMSWLTDETLAGTAFFDNDGDFAKDDGTLAITMVDCATVTIP